jgi:Rieske Fe-S protein
MKRSAFIRGLAAAAGLVAAGGALGTAARVAAKQAPAAKSAAPAATGAGRFLGSVTAIAKGQAATYTDPASGDPALLIHQLNGNFVAFDAVCTHAGCTVQFDAKRQLIVCPCHGATYDPAQAAKPIGGPTNQALAPLAIRVDASQTAYALDAKANGSQANQLKPASAYAGQTGDDGGGRGGLGDGSGGGDDGNATRPATRRTPSLRAPTPSKSAKRAVQRAKRTVRADD